MKSFVKPLSVLALIVGFAPFAAKADQISFSSVGNTSSGTAGSTYCTNSAGCGSLSYGSVDFTPASNNAVVSGSSTGIFSGITYGDATFYNFNYANPSSSAVTSGSTFELFTITEGSETITFYGNDSSVVGSIDTAGDCQNETCLNVTGTGIYYITINGVTTDYSGTFTLQVSGDTTGTMTESFQVSDASTGGSLAATPEPNSLMLMGTGLVGVGATLLRRRRGAAEVDGPIAAA